MINKNAKWIWANDNPQKNEYAYFEEKFNFSGKKAEFFIAAETDYILYVNGKQAAFAQFAGYPFEKYYDTIDITKFCKASTTRAMCWWISETCGGKPPMRADSP